MRRIYLILSVFVLSLLSCTSKENSPEFIEKAQGRYLFNANEVIEVYFVAKELKLNFRGKELSPIKVNDSTFYVNELTEKFIFNLPKNSIDLFEQTKHKGKKYSFVKLKTGEKTPNEYFAAKNFEKAKSGFLAIQKQDSLNPVIEEYRINRLGYKYLKNDEFENAIELFKINIALYPKSSNTYDSTADAYLKNKDTIRAIEYYKKALAINPERNRTIELLKKLQGK